MFSVGSVMQILYERLQLKLGGPHVSWETEDNAVSSDCPLTASTVASWFGGGILSHLSSISCLCFPGRRSSFLSYENVVQKNVT